MEWLVKDRRHGQISEYVSVDGRWALWSQPFTPVWHVEFDGKFVRDFTRVSDARTWVVTEGTEFVVRHADELATAAPAVRR